MTSEKATYRKPSLKVYKVECWSSWFLVRAENMRQAKRSAVLEWGVRATHIKLAKQSCIDWYTGVRGGIGEVC